MRFPDARGRVFTVNAKTIYRKFSVNFTKTRSRFVEITASTIASEIGKTTAMVGVYRRKAEKKIGKTLGKRSENDYRKTVYSPEEKALILAEAPPRAVPAEVDAELVEGDNEFVPTTTGGRIALHRGSYAALSLPQFDAQEAALELKSLDAYSAQGANLLQQRLTAVAVEAFAQAEYRLRQSAMGAEAIAMQAGLDGLQSMGKPPRQPQEGA